MWIELLVLNLGLLVVLGFLPRHEARRQTVHRRTAKEHLRKVHAERRPAAGSTPEWAMRRAGRKEAVHGQGISRNAGRWALGLPALLLVGLAAGGPALEKPAPALESPAGATGGRDVACSLGHGKARPPGEAVS
ncbi:MAG: hypothetical protein ACE5HP_07745 [Gemmatimonadota bacterium]